MWSSRKAGSLDWPDTPSFSWTTAVKVGISISLQFHLTIVLVGFWGLEKHAVNWMRLWSETNSSTDTEMCLSSLLEITQSRVLPDWCVGVSGGTCWVKFRLWSRSLNARVDESNGFSKWTFMSPTNITETVLVTYSSSRELNSVMNRVVVTSFFSEAGGYLDIWNLHRESGYSSRSTLMQTVS